MGFLQKAIDENKKFIHEILGQAANMTGFGYVSNATMAFSIDRDPVNVPWPEQPIEKYEDPIDKMSITDLYAAIEKKIEDREEEDEVLPL